MDQEAVAKELIATRGTRPGWSYVPETPPYTEPTSLACLALRASGTAAAAEDSTAGLGGAARWLATIQQPDGSLGLSADLTQPPWPTALAVLAWAELGTAAGEREKAVRSLMQLEGRASERVEGSVIGDDTTLKGWPWMAGTYSWVETTAMAMLALCREGQADHPRVKEGVKLLVDRALPEGGWNCGSREVFGQSLRPFPMPTGIAMLALAGRHPPDAIIEKSVTYLTSVLPLVRAPESLSWGLLALTAWGRRPAEADAWIDRSYRELREGGSRSMQLAALLLAASANGTKVLGVEVAR